VSLGRTDIDYTKLNEWQRVEKTFTIDNSKPVDYVILYGPWSNHLKGTFIADNVQLEAWP